MGNNGEGIRKQKKGPHGPKNVSPLSSAKDQKTDRRTVFLNGPSQHLCFAFQYKGFCLARVVCYNAFKRPHSVFEVWFQESLPGQGCPQHEHGTLSRYSWVYYLDVGENNSPLTFIEMKETKNEVFPVDEIHLPVYNDMVVMFPSNIHHKVYPVNATRYILAGNINDIAQKEN